MAFRSWPWLAASRTVAGSQVGLNGPRCTRRRSTENPRQATAGNAGSNVAHTLRLHSGGRPLRCVWLGSVEHDRSHAVGVDFAEPVVRHREGVRERIGGHKLLDYRGTGLGHERHDIDQFARLLGGRRPPLRDDETAIGVSNEHHRRCGSVEYDRTTAASCCIPASGGGADPSEGGSTAWWTMPSRSSSSPTSSSHAPQPAGGTRTSVGLMLTISPLRSWFARQRPERKNG